MKNQTIWTSDHAIADWFNQLGDVDSFLKDNGFSRQKLATSQVVLTGRDMIVVLRPVERLEVQKTNVELNIQKALKLGQSMITLEMFIDHPEVENAAVTLSLDLPIGLEPVELFDYIDSKIVELENARKELTAAYRLAKEMN